MKTNIFKPRKASDMQVTAPVESSNYLDTIEQSTLNQSGYMKYTAGKFSDPYGMTSPNI